LAEEAAVCCVASEIAAGAIYHGQVSQNAWPEEKKKKKKKEKKKSNEQKYILDDDKEVGEGRFFMRRGVESEPGMCCAPTARAAWCVECEIAADGATESRRSRRRSEGGEGTASRSVGCFWAAHDE
jgi:hypothetical protein